MTQQSESWEAKVARVRAARDAGLAKVDPPLKNIPEQLPQNSLGIPTTVLTERELEITENYSVTQLLAALRERKISVEEVTRAFLRRAAVAHAAVSSTWFRSSPGGEERSLRTYSSRPTVLQIFSGTRRSSGHGISIPCQSLRAHSLASPFRPRSTMASPGQAALKLLHHLLAGSGRNTVQICFTTPFGRKAVSYTPGQHNLKALCISKQIATSTASQSTHSTGI